MRGPACTVLWLLASSVLGTNGARLSAQPSKALNNLNAVEELHRYRAFNESGIRLLLAGEDLPLVEPTEPSSLAEVDGTGQDVQLPRAWRSKLEITKWLGAGTFGKVFKCKVLCERHRDVYVSVKYIQEKSKLVRTEIGVLEQMKDYSDFCISAIGSPSYIEDSHGFWIMMPYMNHGDLHDFISKCHKNPQCRNTRSQEGRQDFTHVDPAFTDAYILVLFHDIVAGTEDLKPANIMVNCQNNMCFAAVIDLGLACMMQPYGCHGGGTPVYMPPEVWTQDAGSLHLPARDVWALGVILYQLVYNRNPPFFSNPQRMVHSYDVSKDPTIRGTKEVDYLIMKMLAKDYRRRPSLATIREELEGLVEATAAPARRRHHVLPSLAEVSEREERLQSSIQKYKRGDRVQWWSTRYQTWLDARVLFARDDGTYLLDTTRSATEEEMRLPQEGDSHTPPGGAPVAPTVAPTVAPPVAVARWVKVPAHHKFKVGDSVQYFSGTYQEWLPAKVVGIKDNGRYDLNIRSDAEESKIRFPPDDAQQAVAAPVQGHKAVDIPVEVHMLRSNAVQRGAALKTPSCL